MYNVEIEMRKQFGSIRKTAEYIADRQNEIRSFFKDEKKVWFIGSGSSFFISQSAARIFQLSCAGFEAYSVSAGDLMLNFEKYEKSFENSIVVCLTRSGSTSEVLKCLELLQGVNCKKLAVCAKKNAGTTEFCDLSLEIEWAFDNSVCQTQTVSNLYSACLAINAVIEGNDLLIGELIQLEGRYEQFCADYEKQLADIGKDDKWDYAVTLADCECAGLILEGSLAFLEICQCKSGFYNVLDVRHGPIVMIDEKTLAIVLVENNEKEYRDLVGDLKNKGAFCVTAGMFPESAGGDFHIELPKLSSITAAAIFVLFSIHIITFNKALSKGINPDEPKGLKPWIELK